MLIEPVLLRRAAGEHAAGRALRLGPGPGPLHVHVRLSEPLLHSEGHDQLPQQLSATGGRPLPLTGPAVRQQPPSHPGQPHPPLAAALLAPGAASTPASPGPGAAEAAADAAW